MALFCLSTKLIGALLDGIFILLNGFNSLDNTLSLFRGNNIVIHQRI